MTLKKFHLVFCVFFLYSLFLLPLFSASAAADPSVVARQVYVDSAIQTRAKVGTVVSKSGDTMMGELGMGDNRITNLADPVNDGDAVNKKWFMHYLQQFQDTLGVCGQAQYMNGGACTSCADLCTDSQACTPTAPMGGVYSFDTNSGVQTRGAACNNLAGNKDTAPSCAAWGQCTGGSAVSCVAGYYKNGTTCSDCTGACSTIQQCTPTPAPPVSSWIADSGVQTRGANCTNANGNTETSAICAAWGTCTGGTIASCVSGYALHGGVCVSSAPISSATSPTGCTSATSTSSVNENGVNGCSGGDAAGVEISSFVVGGYCGSTAGTGSYTAPQAQSCSDCSPATSEAGQYCYCKIHSINGTNVVSSSRFVFLNNRNSGNRGSTASCIFRKSRISG